VSHICWVTPAVRAEDIGAARCASSSTLPSGRNFSRSLLFIPFLSNNKKLKFLIEKVQNNTTYSVVINFWECP
jgi:hypothetical protein